MQYILTLLHELDQLYHPDALEAYEIKWRRAVQRIERDFPGFTLAYAELYNSGTSRLPNGAIRHVVVPANRVQLEACTGTFSATY